MNQPLVSCVCPTFGKTLHLNEAVESFLIQDYPNKELIIFNNYPHMDIEFNHPLVKVINYKEDIVSMGNFRNESRKHAQGDYICTWDDDDIYLPERVSMEMKHLLALGGKGITINAIYSEANNLIKEISRFLSSSLIEKRYLDENPYTFTDGEDVYMYNKMKSEGIMVETVLTVPQYIYRWATGTHHISGISADEQGKRDRMMTWANGIGLPRKLKLTPYWERNYISDVYDFVNSNK